MVVEKLEDTLNGGYAGLFGEVYVNDCYKLQSIDWPVSLVVDIGANVGVFARFARKLFPSALIVCVEPDPENFAHLTKFTDPVNMVFINKGLAMTRLFKQPAAVNGAHESYFSNQLGFDQEYLNSNIPEATQIGSIMIDEIMYKYGRSKSIMKIDCEGAENIIWGHERSMHFLKQVDYLVMELHWAMSKYDHDTMKRVVKPTVTALLELSHTHHCTLEGDYFFAIKK